MEDAPPLVLLVDDDNDHAELVMRSLSEHPILNRVIRLANGEMVLDYLFRRGDYTNPALSPRPQLILLDLRLPRISGLEVLQTLKASEALRPIPIVIFTTSDAEQDVVRAYQYHANSYLVKPLDFAQFTRLIEEVGIYWLTLNRRMREP